MVFLCLSSPKFGNTLISLASSPTFGTREIKDFTAPSLPEYEMVSLFEPYSVDYKKVLRVREENMKKYPYHYNKFGIDKRSGLSLQEFWDVYDGKW